MNKVYMNKVYITDEQIKTLEKAWDSVVGTSDYTKYHCEWYFKSHRKNNWTFSGYGSPARKGYFKKVCGETFIYLDADDYGDFRRVKLNEACKELLNIK